MTACPDPRYSVPIRGGYPICVRDKGALNITDYDLISFAVWEEEEACPYCGSEDIEYAENGYDAWAYCCDCGKRSANIVDDAALDDAMNAFVDAWLERDDRFDTLDNFEKEQPGWGF